MVHQLRSENNTRALDAKLIYMLAQESNEDRPLTVKAIRHLLIKHYGSAPSENTIYHHLTYLTELTEELESATERESVLPYLVRKKGRAYGEREAGDDGKYGYYIEPALSRAEAALILAGMESAGVSSEAWRGISERIITLSGLSLIGSTVGRRERIASDSWTTFLTTLDGVVSAISQKMPIYMRDAAYEDSNTDIAKYVATGCWTVPLRVAYLGNGILYLVGVVIDEQGEALAGDGHRLHVFRIDHIELLDNNRDLQKKLAPVMKKVFSMYEEDGEDPLSYLLGTKAQPDYEDYSTEGIVSVELKVAHPELLESFYGLDALKKLGSSKNGQTTIQALTTRNSIVHWILEFGLDGKTEVVSPQWLKDELAEIGRRLIFRFG